MVETTNNSAISEVSSGKKALKRVKRSLPSLPSMASASDMNDVNYAAKVDATPITWDALPIHAVFSLSPDGSYPMVKVHRSKYIDLRTTNSYPCGSGRCYRVII